MNIAYTVHKNSNTLFMKYDLAASEKWYTLSVHISQRSLLTPFVDE